MQSPCAREGCGRVHDECTFSQVTTCGYRSNYYAYRTHFFCSDVCQRYFVEHQQCYRCHEKDGDNSVEYIPTLGHALCISRGDLNPGCILKYGLEEEYRRLSHTALQWRIVPRLDDVHVGIPSYQDYRELYDLMRAHDQRVSFEFLRDLHEVNTQFRRSVALDSCISDAKCIHCDGELEVTNGTSRQCFYVRSEDCETEGLICPRHVAQESHGRHWNRFTYLDYDFVVQLERVASRTPSD